MSLFSVKLLINLTQLVKRKITQHENNMLTQIATHRRCRVLRSRWHDS